MERPRVTLPRKMYGYIVYWGCNVATILCIIGPVIAIAYVDNNVLNPHYLFPAIWEGKTVTEVWQEAGDGFPGGHFWLNNLTLGDGITQLGIVIGCGIAGFAMIFTAIAFLWEKPRSPGWALISLWVGIMIFLAATGVVAIK